MLNWGGVIASTHRPCGDCHKCCEGLLTADVLGYPIGYGVKCVYLHKTCNIYPVRPQVCKSYICEWKSNNAIPKHFQPHLTNVIMHRGVIEDFTILKVFDFNPSKNEEIFHWLKEAVDKDMIKHVRHMHVAITGNLETTITGLSKDQRIKKLLEE